MKDNETTKQLLAELEASERQRQQLEESLKTLLNGYPAGTCVIQDGKFQLVNPQFEKLSGYSYDELLGKECLSLVFPEDRNIARENALKMLKGKRWAPYEFRAIDKAGNIRWVIETMAPLTYQGKQAAIGTHMDITERVQAEDIFRILANSSPVGVYIVQDRKLQFVNQQFQKLTGYSQEELLGKDSFSLVVPEDRGMVRENAVKMLKGERSLPYEYRTFNKSGEIKWIVETMSPVTYRGRRAVLGNYMDITERKQAEEKLRETETLYHTIFETTGTATAITEADGTISLANAEFAKLIGYPKAELENRKNWAEIVHKDDLDRVRQNHRLRKHDPSTALRRYEYRIVTRDGSVRDVLVTADLIPGTQRVVISLLDITERKQVELEHKTIPQTAMDGFWLVDTQGRFLDVNNAYCSLVGYSREELLTMRIQDVEAAETQEETDRHIKSIMQAGQDRFETRHRRKGGGIVDCEVSVNYLPVGGGRLFVFLRDITERKRAEEKLHESEQKLRLTFEAAAEGITLTDLQGKIIDINPARVHMHGYQSKEELIGKNTMDLVAETDRPKMREVMKRVMKEGAGSGIEYRLVRKDGNQFIGEINAAAIRDNQGKTVGFVGITRYITEPGVGYQFASYR